MSHRQQTHDMRQLVRQSPYRFNSPFKYTAEELPLAITVGAAHGQPLRQPYFVAEFSLCKLRF